MTKPVHPIRRLRRDLEGHYIPRVIWPPSNAKVEATIARHVKPLLDALDVAHQVEIGLGEEEHPPEESCDVCRLLAAWRAKP